MIWPFNRSRDDSATTGSVDAEPTQRRSLRTWRLLQVEPALVCNLACIMCPWRGETGRLDGSGLMDRRR